MKRSDLLFLTLGILGVVGTLLLATCAGAANVIEFQYQYGGSPQYARVTWSYKTATEPQAQFDVFTDATLQTLSLTWRVWATSDGSGGVVLSAWGGATVKDAHQASMVAGLDAAGESGWAMLVDELLRSGANLAVFPGVFDAWSSLGSPQTWDGDKWALMMLGESGGETDGDTGFSPLQFEQLLDALGAIETNVADLTTSSDAQGDAAATYLYAGAASLGLLLGSVTWFVTLSAMRSRSFLG